METITIEFSDIYYQRALDGCTDIPLDPKTKEPIMSEKAWLLKFVRADTASGIRKREKLKAAQAEQANNVKVTEQDLSIS